MKIAGLLFATMLLIPACAPATPVSLTQSPAPAPTLTQAPSPAPTLRPKLEPFGRLEIDPGETAFQVSGSGSNVDSIAFWEAPDPADSLMIVTSKGNASIEVYRYPFSEQHSTLSCGEASNGVWVDQARDVLYITERYSSRVCAYDLPGLKEKPALGFTTAASGDDSEPNLAMLPLPDGHSRIYVSYDDRVYYHDAESGAALGEFEPAKGLETMYGDDYYQVLYIPDEGDRSGVYLYDQDGNSAGAKFGDDSIFDSDAEGIGVYRCHSADAGDTGEGLIVVSDQKDKLTDFEVFNRKTKAYLGKINISGVNNTDGLAITQQASPAYPAGLLAVIDDDESTVGVGWDIILEKTGLSCGG